MATADRLIANDPYPAAAAGMATTPHERLSGQGVCEGDELPVAWDHSAFEVDSWFGGRATPTAAEWLRGIELDGYAVVPGILPPPLLAELRAATAQFETTGRDYSSRQRGYTLAGLPDIDAALLSPRPSALGQLPAHSPTLERLDEAFGGLPMCSGMGYDVSHIGTPGISLHTDSQPFGSTIFGGAFSGSALIRVLYYLDDLTLDTSPFRCIPRSHLSLHEDANPYTRYSSHPEQRVVTLPAGSALFLNGKLFHGTLPNTGTHDRRMLAVAYRPAWAGPAPIGEPLPQWDPEAVSRLGVNVRALFSRDPNLREGFVFEQSNKQEGMKGDASGVRPSRWRLLGRL